MLEKLVNSFILSLKAVYSFLFTTELLMKRQGRTYSKIIDLANQSAFAADRELCNAMAMDNF
jgi:hypothetical protein